MMMPGRKFEQSGKSYRYSINGQEKSDEVAPNSTTAEYWQYDARIGRRWNVDPVVKVYESPYSTFGNSPIWIMDPSGADSTPVHNRIIGKDGKEITTPTVVNLQCSRINPQQYPGMRCVGNNQVEVTPGDFTAQFSTNDGGNTQLFRQVPSDRTGGQLFTWQSYTSNGIIPPPPPPPATPIVQFNNQITGVQNVNGPVGAINRNFNIAFNPASGTADAARFSGNAAAGIAQITGFANQLRANGITTGVNITIGTDFVSTTSPSNQYGTSGGLLTARANYIQGLFAARGVTANIRPPAMGTSPNINARINANVIGLIGWNVTTQAMQRQVLRGNVIPGSTQAVPGSLPATNFQRRGGARPTVGNFTGTWR